MVILKCLHLVKKAWTSVHPHVLINAFIKVGFKSTLNQPMIQTPENSRDLIEDFAHYVFIDECLSGEVACLEFHDEELDELFSNPAKRRKEEDEYGAFNALQSQKHWTNRSCLPWLMLEFRVHYWSAQLI
ncbi:unnamed protein product [Echinostoma caproni]|uniref:DDE-1 domain-containing protein n=1 Tax=Echinostoma caproni TaxID=27848 RepID=A0A183AJ82_9TREM|nr:unnamed protein product [Echinostoma caproni]